MTTPHWSDADYYASLLGVGKQQVDLLPAVGGRAVGIQLVLGDDARLPHPGPPAFAGVDLAVTPPDPAFWAAVSIAKLGSAVAPSRSRTP